MAARPHAFVAMPFGRKPLPKRADASPDSQPEVVDFDRVYDEYIRPALEQAGFEPFRADDETRAGDIRTDMFQELLVADMVVADLTVDNPNVWYEIGVRHALRARGVVLVCGGRTATAFDLYTDRKLRYGLSGGGPDPATLATDIDALAGMIRDTMDAWHGRKVSPVYQLMPNLQEPDWTSLRIGAAREFWEAHDAWQDRVDLAGRTGCIGDLLVLADEAPVSAFRVDAWIAAGKALRRAEHFHFALEHLEHGLERDPDNLELLREKGMCLERLAAARQPGFPPERARQHYQNVLERYPRDTETWTLLGRVDKDAWTTCWARADTTLAQKRDDAAYEEALLRAAIDSYEKAYRSNPCHYYSGINALTLMHLHRDLTGETRYDGAREIMAGAVRFAAECEVEVAQGYWAKATLGDLEVLVGTPETVTRAYKEAVARNDGDWFALRSSRRQLGVLQDLGFAPERVQAGVAVFERALGRLAPPTAAWQPRQVILFSGHMVDAPDRTEPRFPADKVPEAARRIAAALDALGAGPEDMALSQAAAGGDLLFIEACQARGVRCQVLLPFPEPTFIEKSVLKSADGEAWRGRYFAMRSQLSTPPRIMPDELGPDPAGVGPFERCNLWLLYTALVCGIDKVRFVCLWNGGGGDGPGGTAHMYNEVKRRTGRVTRIDTRDL